MNVNVCDAFKTPQKNKKNNQPQPPVKKKKRQLRFYILFSGPTHIL